MNLEELKTLLSGLLGLGLLAAAIVTLIGDPALEGSTLLSAYVMLGAVCAYQVVLVATLAGEGSLVPVTIFFPLAAAVFFFTPHWPAGTILLLGLAGSWAAIPIGAARERRAREALEEVTLVRRDPEGGDFSALAVVEETPAGAGPGLVVSQYAGTVQVLSADDGSTLRTHRTLDEIPFCMVAHGGRGVVVTIQGGVVRTWHLDSGELLDEIIDLGGLGNSFSLSPDGARILICANQGPVYLHELDRGGAPRALDFLGPDALDAVFAGSGDRILASAGPTALWDLKRGELVLELPELDRRTTLVVSPDGRTILANYGERRVEAWDASSGRRRWKKRAAGLVLDLAVSPDGHVGAACGAARRVSLFHLEDGRRLNQDVGGRGDYHQAAFHPDGRTLFLLTRTRVLRTRVPLGFAREAAS